MRTTPEPMLADFYKTLQGTGLVRRVLELARDEDLGTAGDVTSNAVISAEAKGAANIALREPGVVAGLAVVPELLSIFAPHASFEPHAADGQAAAGPCSLGVLRGPSRELLAAERALLNVAGRLCGVATRTAEFVAAMGPTKAQLCDTRKTTPGLRVLEKYAVRCGGGHSHRLGLHDAILIKDNHLAGVAVKDLASWLTQTLTRAKSSARELAFVEVEVDSLDQFQQVLGVEAGLVDIVLLDNMTPEVLKQAVVMRDAAPNKVLLEASGGVNLGTIRAVGSTGVDRVSVGSLTHGARSLDVGLDWI